MVNTEDVWYRGIRFRRYPDSPHRSFRVYYRPETRHAQQGVKYLHSEIWQDTHHDTVQAGHHVHHVDFNPLNNDPANLVRLTHAEHMAAHAGEPVTEAQRAHLANIRPMTVEWHQSDEGRQWHREHARRVADAAEPRAAFCTRCGQEYMSKLPRLFCSNNCKSAARRESGVDNVARTCPACGKVFTVSKYSKVKHCSRKCGSGKKAAA